ncbi:MAG: hypothetical protein ACM3ZF_01980 [Mycobacterium leprae]
MRPRFLLVTFALVVAGLASQQLSAAADAAETSRRPAVAADDRGVVPRLVRTAHLEAPVSGTPGCWAKSAVMSADGHTALLACQRYGGEPGAVVVLSDAFRGGAWRVTTRIDVPTLAGAALSADGRTLAIGDDYHRQAWVYTVAGGRWRRTATIHGSSGGWFGSSIALSGDARTLAFEAFQGFSRERRRGALYLYRRTSSSWSRQAVIGSPVATLPFFGQEAIALSMTGDTVVIGAPGTSPSNGATFVYRRMDGKWRLLTTLDGPGHEVAVSTDGGTLAVREGRAVSVFRERASAGFVRSGSFEVGWLPLPLPLTLSGDGQTLVVGDPQRTLHGVRFAGRVHRFVHTGGGWRFGGVLDPRDGELSYGAAVAVDATGRRVLVAANLPQRWGAVRVVGDLYQRPAVRPPGYLNAVMSVTSAARSLA